MLALKIDGVELPTPTTMDVASYDITDASRNDKGDALIDYITTKEKISCAWDFLTDGEKNIIMNTIKSPEHMTFDVTFYSINGGSKTLKCYKGEISAEIALIDSGVKYWNGFKVNFIQL